MRERVTNWWALIVAIAGAVVLAIVATTPPAPVAATAPASAFSAARAMTDVRVIGRAPHPTGSAEDAAVRGWLATRLKAMGLEVSTPTGTMDAKAAERLAGWRGTAAPTPPLVNVVGVLPGRDRSLPAVLLMAHHDSVWGSPGAADDGAGVASILETVRAITASGQPARDLIVLFTDGEELGLEGAKAFFATDPRRSHVGVIVNLETRGGGGRASMFETGRDDGAMMAFFGRAVRRPVATSLSVFIYQHLPNSTDYTVAKQRDHPGFNFAFIGRPALYHSPLATPDALDQGALQDMGRQVLDLTSGLLAAPVLPGPAADRVFFDAFGLFLIGYPVWVGWLLLVVAAVAYGFAAAGRTRPGAAGRGALAAVAVLIGSGLLLFVGNLASGADGKVNYYDRLAAIPRLEVQALLLCLAGAALVWGLLVGRRAQDGLVAGFAIPLFLLALIAQTAAPTAAFPLVWPLLLGGIAAAVERLAGAKAGLAAGVAAAMLGIGYLVALGFLLIEAVGPGMPMVAALPLTLATLLAAPLVPPIGRRVLLRGAAVLVVAALAIALWVRLDAVAPSIPAYSVDK